MSGILHSIEMFTSLSSFSSRTLFYHEFLRFSLPEVTKCNVWVGIFKLIYLDWLITHIHFGSCQPIESLKTKSVASLIRERGSSYQLIYLKRTWPIHQFLRPIWGRFLTRTLLPRFFTKSRCRSSRSKIIRNIHRETLVTGVSFLIKLQAFSCFPENIAKYFDQLFIEHLRWLLL